MSTNNLNLFDLSKFFEKKGIFKEYIDFLKELLEIDQMNEIIWDELGDIYVKTNDITED